MKFSKRKIVKKIGIGLGIFIMALLIAIWYFEPIATKYINDNANTLLNKNPENPFTYEVGEIKLDIWKGGFHVDSFKLIPKDSTKKLFERGKLKSLIEVELKGVFSTGLKFYELYKSGDVILDEIKIQSPKINFRSNAELEDTTAQVPLRELIKEMTRELTIGEVNFENVSLNLSLDHKDTEKRIFIDSLNFVIQQLHVSSQTADMELLFEVKDIFVESERINYKLNDKSSIELNKFHFSLIEENLSCKELQFKLDGFSMIKTDSVSLRGVDLARLIDSNQIHFDEISIYKPVVSLKDEKKEGNTSAMKFHSLFEIPVTLKMFNVVDAEVRILEKLKNKFTEKVNISEIDFKIRGLSNTKLDRILGKIVYLDSLKFRCNPKLTFKDNESGESKNLSIDNFELDVEGLRTDSVIFDSDLVVISNFFRMDFDKLEYEVSNMTRIEILDFEIDKLNEILHLGKVKVQSLDSQKGKSKLEVNTDKIDIHGVSVKTIIRKGEIDLNKMVAEGVHINLEQWEKKSQKPKVKIDLQSYLGIPIHLKKVKLLKADFNVKRHLLNTQIEEMKIADVDVHIDGVSNKRMSKGRQEISFNKVMLDCKPRIMIMDSLGEIDRVLLMDDLKVEFNHVYTNKNIINSSLPIRIDDYSVDFGGLIYNLDSYYTLKVADIRFNKLRKMLTFDEVSIRSKYLKREHMKRVGVQTEWLDCKIKSVDIMGLDIKEILTQNKFFVNRISLNSVELELQRDKNYERPLFKRKPLPVEQILAIPFPFNISTVDVNDMSLVYRETPKGKEDAGVINFFNTVCEINNVTNVKSQIARNNKMTLDLSSQFMKDISLNVKYKFDLSNSETPFTLEGEVENFNMAQMDETMYKLLGVGVNSGKVNWIKFWLEGDNEKSNGWFDMHYEDFKVESEMKRDVKIFGIRTNWFLTGAANAIILSSNTNVRKFRRGIISTGRKKDRSIFNYSWHSIKTGIMSSMGLKKHKKIELD